MRAVTACTSPKLTRGLCHNTDLTCGRCTEPVLTPLSSLAEYSAEQIQQALHQSVFMSSMFVHPFRDLPLNRERHCKLLPGVADIQANQVPQWTVDEVSRAALGCWDGIGRLLRFSHQAWEDALSLWVWHPLSQIHSLSWREKQSTVIRKWR